MCTVSLVTRENGYLLAMNRDEKIARGPGLPAQIRRFDPSAVICPDAGDGGTWIGASEHGITLALLNWNDVGSHAAREKGGGGLTTKSRGQIIPAVGCFSSITEMQAEFGLCDLGGTLPFRLVAVSPVEAEVCEWRWDGSRLDFGRLGWKSRHWFSSGLSDAQAESLRGAACREASVETDFGTELWIRRLHASHAGGAGPFSLCVHRDDVETLSYSQVVCTPDRMRMSHFAGPPCTMGPIHAIEIERSRNQDLRAPMEDRSAL